MELIRKNYTDICRCGVNVTFVVDRLFGSLVGRRDPG